ncbi:uncharacterized protein PV09_02625 [Verruconis gallopava]|uniref:Uncharacterized protein n=1 Tax=Verruconis gallopava TaxID=253628 RepID=A0A0D1XW50_9PEZI|nr:uncharacterized protein PV09_02625 [Verruconis gallopava]KIW06966.1 hypothetical protein PV09_02625 [Verruconis gallopava]
MQYWAVIVLVMAGGGALVLIAYAVLRNFTDPDNQETFSFSEEQLRYMRELRQRNLDNLVAEMTAKGYGRTRPLPMEIYRQGSRGGDTSGSSEQWG